MTQKVTAQFGAYEVPGVLLEHRQVGTVWDAGHGPDVVVVSVPVALTEQEITAVLYATVGVGERCDAKDARYLIAEMLVNQGCGGVESDVCDLADKVEAGTVNKAHLRACGALARAAYAPPAASARSCAPAVSAGRRSSRALAGVSA